MYRFKSNLILFLLIPVSVFASETDHHWNRIGKQICQQLNSAAELYRKNDFKKARTEALMAYFKSYDSEIQPVIRPLLGSKPIMEREQQFRQFAQTLSINHVEQHDQHDVQQQADALCSHIIRDMSVLKKNNIKPIQPFFD